MEEDEWRQLVSNINKDIAGIVSAQRTLDEVNAEISARARHPIEEDFIHADAFGPAAHEPQIVEVDGVKISTRMLHRRGLRQTDIKGADLLYEIAGKKFVLIQYKTPGRRQRVALDREQLNNLIRACPNPCPPYSLDHLPTCGSWYAVRGAEFTSYLPACKALKVFGTANSRDQSRFSEGISYADFQKLFARCYTGARVSPPEPIYIESDRVLFIALQNAGFEKW